MGNFHIDFSMDGACNGIYAVESIFLGKKTYIDILESTDLNGDTINQSHIRMKGIPNKCIQYKAELENISVLDTYKKLYNGSEINYDLTNDGTKANFKFNKDCSVSTVGEFNRRVKFNNNNKEYID